MKKMRTFLGKYKWWILVVIFLYPFYCLLIGEIWNFGKLYTFGLSLSEFMTVWIALGGIIGVVSNVRLTQKRITIQEEQQINQQKQFEEQIEKQNDQIQIQQKQLRDTRFSSGVELLGNNNESARIGGAYNLYFLAKENSEDYLMPVCGIFCAHIRTITSSKEYREEYKNKPSNEIQTILKLLFRRRDNYSFLLDDNKDTIFYRCYKDLSGTFLCGVEFFYTKMDNVNFRNAELYNVDFTAADLSCVHFSNAVLNDVNFGGAELDVEFKDAELKNINFSNAKFRQMMYFKGTVLENYSWEEITREGRSLELTKPNENGNKKD
jgi:uncharacterized protein YjbI with pentapeptide repeats